MFAELRPNIFFGGDSAKFWAPLAWTLIFGLIFAFFMTLFILPGMYLVAERLRRPMRRQFGGKWVSMAGLLPLVSLAFATRPLLMIFVLLAFPLMMIYTMIRHRIEVRRRRRRLAGRGVSETWIKSWF
jgi:amino acid transporter